MKPNFEMANSDDPKGIVLAAQKSIISVMKTVISEVRKQSNAPGLTWDQIDYLLDLAEKKEPIVIEQKDEF